MFDRVVRVAVVLLVLLNAGLFYAALTRDRTASVDRTPTQVSPTHASPTHASPTHASPTHASPTHEPTRRSPATTATTASTASTASAPETTSEATRPTKTVDASPSAATEAIVLTRGAYEAEPFRVVRVTGTLRTGSPAARGRVHVEMRQGDGWSTFPLPAVTGSEGRFTAFVSIGSPGRYRMRVVAAGGRPASDPFLVTIR